MLRLFIALITLFAVATIALGQTYTGTMTLAFGKIRNAEGKMISVEGMKIPITITPVRAHLGPFPKRYRHVKETQPAIQTVYLNDNGEATYFYTPESPSELDDIVLNNAGANAPWTQLTLGLHCGTTQTVLLRWRMWDTQLSGTPPGVNAFTNELVDIGGYFDLDWPQSGGPLPPNAEGQAYKITFGLNQLPPVIPDGSCFMAFQIREPNIAGWPPAESGEGAFVPEFSPVFSGGGVQIGSSEDVYWHDNNLDGIYDSDEVDYFGGPPSQANFLMKVETSGTVLERYPTSYLFEIGTAVTPEVDYLHFDDNEYFIANSQGAPTGTAYPIRFRIDSSVPTTGLTSYRFYMQTRAPFHGIEQVIEFFNFQQFQWVERSRVMLPPNTDANVEANLQSGISQFVDTGTIKRIRARISYRSLFVDPALLTMQIDKATWTVGYP